jgi:hypothetical protein
VGDHYSNSSVAAPDGDPAPPSIARRFAGDPKIALAGGFILTLTVLAIFAPWIASQDLT